MIHQCSRCHATGGDGNALPVVTTEEWQEAARKLAAAQERLESTGGAPWAVWHVRAARRHLNRVARRIGPDLHRDCGGAIRVFR